MSRPAAPIISDQSISSRFAVANVFTQYSALTVHLVLAGKASAGAIKCTPQMEPVGTRMGTASALANKEHVVASTVAVDETMISAVQESASQGTAKASNHILMYSS